MLIYTRYCNATPFRLHSFHQIALTEAYTHETKADRPSSGPDHAQV